MQLLFSVKATATALSISRSTLYTAMREGKIAAIKHGKLTMFHRDEIERYVCELPAAKHPIN